MQLKDMYNTRYVGDVAAAVQDEYPAFDVESFTSRVFGEEWEARELKGRMRYIALMLHNFLPADYRAALDILRRVSFRLDDYGFENMIFSDYVAVYGLDDWEASIPALARFTRQVSAEFAVRPFIVQDQDRMMAQMLEWAKSDNPHLRRLATEGCRPRLALGDRAECSKSGSVLYPAHPGAAQRRRCGIGAAERRQQSQRLLSLLRQYGCSSALKQPRSVKQQSQSWQTPRWNHPHLSINF